MSCFLKNYWLPTLLLVASLSSPFYASAQALDKSSPSPQGITKLHIGNFFKSSLFKFKIKIPKEWRVDNTLRAFKEFYDKKYGRPSDFLGSRLSIQLDTSEYDFPTEVSNTRDYWINTVSEHTFDIDESFKIPNAKGHLLGGNWFEEEENTPLTFRELIVKKGKARFRIQAIMPTQEWEMNHKVFDQIFKSFRVIK